MDVAVVPEDESKVEEDKEGSTSLNAPIKNAVLAEPKTEAEQKEAESHKSSEDELYTEAVIDAAAIKERTKAPAQAVSNRSRAG